MIADQDVIRALLPPGLSVARFHGTVAGLLCAEGAGEANSGVLARGLRELLGSSDGDLDEALLDVVAATSAGLDSFELEFELMVPDDESPVTERLAGLAEWCAAFLDAFRSADAILDEEGEEALADLDAIAELDAEAGEEDDEVELDFVAVAEHVRIAVLLLRASTQFETDDEDVEDDDEAG